MRQKHKCIIVPSIFCYLVAWENSRHLATLPLVPQANKVWVMLRWVESNFLRGTTIRSTTQIWVVTRHQYEISALVPQTSFRRRTAIGVAKRQLFSQSSYLVNIWQKRSLDCALLWCEAPKKRQDHKRSVGGKSRRSRVLLPTSWVL